MIEYHTPGNHVRLHIGADARLHIKLNKETIASFDMEHVLDEVMTFVKTTRSRRPGLRRRVLEIVPRFHHQTKQTNYAHANETTAISSVGATLRPIPVLRPA